MNKRLSPCVTVKRNKTPLYALNYNEHFSRQEILDFLKNQILQCVDFCIYMNLKQKKNYLNEILLNFFFLAAEIIFIYRSFSYARLSS